MLKLNKTMVGMNLLRPTKKRTNCKVKIQFQAILQPKAEHNLKKYF